MRYSYSVEICERVLRAETTAGKICTEPVCVDGVTGVALLIVAGGACRVCPVLCVTNRLACGVK